MQARLRIPQTLSDVYGRSGLCDADELLTGGPAQPVMVSIRSEEQVEVLGAQLAEGRVAVSSAAPIDLVVPLWKPIPIIGQDAAGRAVSLTLTPQSAGEVALNLAVLVDHSGSMASAVGSPGSLSAHEAARNGIANLAHELAQGDIIDLWEFDTQFRQVGLIEAEASDLAAASNSLTSLAARLSPPSGGTEIGGALKAVIKSSGAKDILLLTDGLSHQLDIDELARCGRRISVVLIGADSLEARIGHLAALTGGDLFIATAEDLADVMKAALDALRRPAAAMPTISDVPEELVCLRNNVELRANWAQVSDGAASSESSRAATAVAASLVVNCAFPEFAAQYAASEGIVSHLTSLVLVDEVGGAQSDLPTMRKVALPSANSASSMRVSAGPSDHDALFDLDSLQVSISHSMESLHHVPTRRKPYGSGILTSRDICSRLVSMGPPAEVQDLQQVVRLIDWGADPERLLRGDFSDLPQAAQQLIEDLSTEDKVVRLSHRYGVLPEIVVIALLARVASHQDRHAMRIWSIIFTRMDCELYKRVEEDFVVPIKKAVQDIIFRLNEDKMMVAMSIYGDSNEIVVEAESTAIVCNSLEKVTDELKQLVQSRVTEAKEEFSRVCVSLQVE